MSNERKWIRITPSPSFLGTDSNWVALRVNECFTIEGELTSGGYYRLHKFPVMVHESNCKIEPNPTFDTKYKYSPDPEIEQLLQTSYRRTLSTVGWHEATDKHAFESTVLLALQKTAVEIESMTNRLKRSLASAEQYSDQAQKDLTTIADILRRHQTTS